MEFVARKVAATSGDCRRALDACRAALEFSRAANNKDASSSPVAFAHAARAVRDQGGQAHGPVAAVATLPHHAHLALRAALDLALRGDDKSFTRAALFAAYAGLQPALGRGGDCAAAAEDSLGLLESSGLVGAAPDRRSKAAKARDPGRARLRLLVDADDARRALETGARTSQLQGAAPRRST